MRRFEQTNDDNDESDISSPFKHASSRGYKPQFATTGKLGRAIEEDSLDLGLATHNMRYGGTLQTESTIDVKRPLKDYSSIMKEI